MAVFDFLKKQEPKKAEQLIAEKAPLSPEREAVLADRELTLIGKSHHTRRIYGQKLYSLGYRNARLSSQNSKQDIRGRDTAGKRGTVKQLTHSVLDDEIGERHSARLNVGAREG